MWKPNALLKVTDREYRQRLRIMTRTKQPASRSHLYSNLESQEEWESAARQLLDEGQAFLACDVARRGIERYPESRPLLKSVALGLIRVGALDEARHLLEPLVPSRGHTQEQLQQVYAALRDVLPGLRPGGEQAAGDQSLAKIDKFVDSLERLLQPAARSDTADEEMLGMLARIYKDQWRRSGDPNLARQSRDLYKLSYEITGGYYTGINAAAMSFVIGEKSAAQALAQAVYERCQGTQASEGSDYWLLATMGEALLLQGDSDRAVEKYREAAEVAQSRYAWIVSSLQQVRMLEQHGVPIPQALFASLKPPEIIVFAGHMIDAEDRPTPRFPAYLETAVRAAIDQRLEELDARIGYCSAACGADILFIEAMLARGAEVNIILPFAEDDFLATSVAFAGDRWLIRYRNVLKQAHSVSFLTEEAFLGDAILFDYLARVFHGYAELRAHTLLTEPLLLAVWDGNPNGPAAGTADFVSRWPDPKRLSSIRIDRLLEAANSLGTGATLQAARHKPSVTTMVTQGKRSIRTMMFADVTGYSKLDEARIPAFLLDFWSKVAGRLTPKPAFVNTWGDAIFAVMDSCLPMMEFALSLQAAVKETVWDDAGVPGGIDIRISLHVGPIFEAVDPMTGRQNFYGSHVNRAARLEPVTVPGHIYATEPFVALLMSEMSASRVAARDRNDRVEFPFAWEYVGMLSLAKNFGEQAAYHIRRTKLAFAMERERR
jgi:class 3 adenylate cyclase/tetratricopeptide (TPR) repeat protein